MAVHKVSETNDAWKDQLREKAEIVRSSNNTDAGKALFKLLEDTFEKRPLRGADANDTYYRLGQRDVVQYLKELLEVTNA